MSDKEKGESDVCVGRGALVVAMMMMRIMEIGYRQLWIPIMMMKSALPYKSQPRAA